MLKEDAFSILNYVHINKKKVWDIFYPKQR